MFILNVFFFSPLDDPISRALFDVVPHACCMTVVLCCMCVVVVFVCVLCVCCVCVCCCFACSQAVFAHTPYALLFDIMHVFC